jgi:general secretion pathway protein N
MRIEGVAPRTWLLATVAGWALLAWLLALLGLGGHVARLPDDPGLLARLPKLAPASPERLGPLAQYGEISARPLFSENRRYQPFSINPDGDDAGPTFDYVLTSVLITPTLREAILQPTAGGESIRVKLGEAPEAQPAYRLTALNPRSAVFEGPDGEHSLDLRVYDGTGGEPPTAVAADSGSSRPSPEASGGGPARRPLQPASRPPVATPATAPAPAPTDTDNNADTNPDASADDAGPNTEAQIESIRKRIEERRAQLRQQAQPPPAEPAKNP